jgi:hypothetical protein
MEKKKIEKELKLSDFDIYTRLNEGMQQTFSLFPDIPLLSMVHAGVGFGRAAIDYLKLDKTSRVIMLKKDGSIYIAVLPFYSKLNGYNIFATGKNNLSCCFKPKSRGFKVGYYEILKPIFVSELDLYELKEFDRLTLKNV